MRQAVMKRFLDGMYRLQRLVWRLLRPRTRGVKILLFNLSGELVLIRNTYGRSDLYVLPGGGAKLFEDPSAAAAREVREELGVEVAELKLRSVHSTSAEGKRDQVYLFEGRLIGPVNVDGTEVQEARLVSPHDLPSMASPATRRRIDEYLGNREPDGTW